MATMETTSHFTFTIGILGNIVAVMVYLSALPTFFNIYKKKSTQGFQSLPYLVTLFSSMLWLYYALLQGNDIFLMTINVVGCLIQSIYISIYFAYAPKSAKILTAMLLCVTLVTFSSIFIVIHSLKITSFTRLKALGVICVVFSIFVFIAPLSIMVKVIQTRSVRFMPFPLSFFLTLNAIIWFFYGLLRKDNYIWLPNVVGFIFGVLQMTIYGACKYYFHNDQDNTVPTQDKVIVTNHIRTHQNGNTDSKNDLDYGKLEYQKSNMQGQSKAPLTCQV